MSDLQEVTSESYGFPLSFVSLDQAPDLAFLHVPGSTKISKGMPGVVAHTELDASLVYIASFKSAKTKIKACLKANNKNHCAEQNGL